MDLSHDHIGKTAAIDRELSCVNLDIVAGSRSLKEENYIFVLEKPKCRPAQTYGVAFAIRNSLVQSISAPTGISERIMSLCLQTTKGYVNLISVYAPALGASPDVKDSFYRALADTVRLMNTDELFFILGDFNARIGNQWIPAPRTLTIMG